MRTLFDEFESAPLIPGLSYIENFISPEEESAMLDAIDQEEWLTDLKRRVQHYGYKYDYRARRIDTSMRLGRLPEWVAFITKRLVDEVIFKAMPDQLIVNEYFQGQGIAPHIDCEPCFEDVVVSLSLNSGVIMDFTRGSKKESKLLERRSLLVMKEESRYEWKHGIVGRRSDLINGIRMPRNRRVSLTFRRVILN